MKLSSEDRPNEDRLNEDRLNEDRHWPPWRRALALCACLFMTNILRWISYDEHLTMNIGLLWLFLGWSLVVW